MLLAKAKNSQAGNFDFAKKKTTYFQSQTKGGGVTPFVSTTQVVGEAA